MIGIYGRKMQSLATVYDVLAKSEGKVAYPIGCLLVADRIVVQRTGNTGKVGVEAVSKNFAHDFLKNNAHLFLFDCVAGGAHIGFTLIEKGGGINGLDSVANAFHDLGFIPENGNHISGIHAGKWLVARASGASTPKASWA